MQIFNDEVAQTELLVPAAFLEASLHDTAAMLVHSDVDAIRNASIKDEVGVLRSLSSTSDVIVLWSISGFELNQKSLDNMVSMHVHDQLDDVLSEDLDDFHQDLVVQGMLL